MLPDSSRCVDYCTRFSEVKCRAPCGLAFKIQAPTQEECNASTETGGIRNMYSSVAGDTGFIPWNHARCEMSRAWDISVHGVWKKEKKEVSRLRQRRPRNRPTIEKTPVVASKSGKYRFSVRKKVVAPCRPKKSESQMPSSWSTSGIAGWE